MSIDIFLDLALATGSIIFAYLSLTTRDLFKSILCFVSMGLVTALVWARLGAWDVAIAEAAIGSGLTGVLLLSSLRSFELAETPIKEKITGVKNDSGSK